MGGRRRPEKASPDVPRERLRLLEPRPAGGGDALAQLIPRLRVILPEEVKNPKLPVTRFLQETDV